MKHKTKTRYGENITTQNELAENVVSENIITENITVANNETESIVQGNDATETVNNLETSIVEMNAGDRVYLTQDELENAEITIQIKYDSKQIGKQEVYNHRIELKTDKKI